MEGYSYMYVVHCVQVHGLVTEPQEPIRVYIQHRVESLNTNE